jgi:DNA-directed RNA polymerase
MSNYCKGNCWDNLSFEQREQRLTLNSVFEEDIFNESMHKYWENYEKLPSMCAPEQALIYRVVDHISDAVEQYLCDLQKRNISWVTPIYLLGPRRVAGLLITVCADTIISQRRKCIESDDLGNRVYAPVLQQDLARAIANTIQTAVNYQQSKQDNPGAWVLASRIVKSRWTKRQIKDFIKHHKTQGHIKMTNKERYYLGLNLLSILERAEIIQLNKFWDGPASSPIAVSFTNHVTEGLTTAHSDFLTRAKIRYRPMIVPPFKHTLDMSGGTHTEHLRKGMVDRGYTYFHGEDYVTEFKGSEPSQAVIDGLNSLMSTEWTVNTRVYEVMDTLFKNNLRVANLPPYELDPVLTQDRLDVDDPAEVERIKKERSELWSEWYRKENERIRMCLRLSIAREMIAYGFFYHVYTCDFRGRAYTVTDLLSPQSGDHDRSLILFANPMKQTERGMYWLKVHLANLFDQDKKSFAKRVKWVDDNIAMLRKINDDPHGTLDLWADDKKKKNQSFQRLAAVFELFRKDGLTQLPVGMDGSCNGIQHWAAIAKDPIIGQMVNLLPCEEPNDAYGVVAAEVTQSMLPLNYKDPWVTMFLEHWEGSIKRSVVKRAVMTDPYGVTTRGITDGLLNDGHLDWIDKTVKVNAARELTKYVQAAMNTLLTIPNQGKVWLKQVSKVASEKQVHLEWTTPIGFKVRHQYYGKTNGVVNLQSMITSMRVEFNEFVRDEVNGREAQNGISPNFIHSLDASHMFAVIIGLSLLGCESYSFIHDSYGVHAPLVDSLRDITRQEFVRIHEVNQLDRLRQQLSEYLEVDLPNVPSTGSLDITKVLESEYFFH